MNPSSTDDALVMYGQSFASRLLLGTARYPAPTVLQAAVQRAKPAMVTASLRRQGSNPAENGHGFWDLLRSLNVPVLPNTAGCHSTQEAITTAQMAREVFNTPWIKLEVIGDDYTLQPDTVATLEAATALAKDGFAVFAYTTDDLVMAQRLHAAGCAAVMPWAAPIGTGRGPLNPYALETMRRRLPDAVLVVDAGLGRPSHAAQVMELGFDAVLLNTAVAQAGDPVRMARAFADGVAAGRAAYESTPMPERAAAQASTSTVGVPFWHAG